MLPVISQALMVMSPLVTEVSRIEPVPQPPAGIRSIV
jgi:hypothetical protein